jgi:glycosyltransferase involved in cell wall biosynthesis
VVSNLADSELNYVIAPEIKDDEFYSAIRNLAKREDIQTVLEIGSSSGAGSTEAFVKGLRENPGNPLLFCMEVSQSRFAALRDRYAADSFVQCYNASSVAIDQFPSEKEVAEFYTNHDGPLKNFSLQRVLGWLQQDIEYVSEAGVPTDGIRRIKQEHDIDCFDLVLIDGSEFTGDVELDEVYGSRYILLDDICTYKNYKSHHRLLADPSYALIAQNTTLRNGYSIFKRIENPPAPRSPQDLPIHFFTIVLNGEPFIRYHIEVLKQLPFAWHWHIVEGVADLKHDTAWSIEHGGKITAALHDEGYSNDGTTEYLNELQQLYPDCLTIYRKPKGVFWDGKREMVNTPLEYIQEECLLWQVDVDELWTAEQISKMRQLFINHPDKTAAFYWCWYFVGEQLVISSRNCYGQNPQQEWLRTWRFRPGMLWEAHEPPRLIQPLPEWKSLDVASMNPFCHAETCKAGLLFQHFAYVTPQQLQFKEQYYGYQHAVRDWRRLQAGAEFPLFLRNYFSWVEDDTIVEPAKDCGVVPIAQYNPDNGSWYFLQSEELKSKMMEVKKPFPQIVIDGVFFQIANSGIARVWKSLLEEWVKTGFAQHLIVLDRDGTAPRIPGIRYRPVPKFSYDNTGADAEMVQAVCDEKQADLFISTYYTTPLTTPSVFMAYDMIPEVIGADLNQTGWREKHFGILHACRYITISENTARDLVRLFPHIPEWAVTVAHCGVPKGFSPASSDEINQFKSQFNLSKPYYLVVGERLGVNWYKNVIFFFRALRKITGEKDFAVVCVGGYEQLEPELAVLVEGVETHVLALNDAELRAAYSGAIALVYPSRYEGFGLPIAEAMACACPVITCRTSSIPEVAGDAALYVDESNLDDLIHALHQVQQSETREALIAAGLKQCQKFSWTKMANIVSRVLLETAESLQNDRTLQVSPIWTEFRKLQTQIQKSPALTTISPTVSLAESQQLQEKLAAVQQKLQKARKRAKQNKAELERTQLKLAEAENQITAMYTSKFWKIRSGWFRIKKMLGLPTNG